MQKYEATRVFGRLLLLTLFCVCIQYGSALGAEKNDADAASEGQQTPEESKPFVPRILPFKLRKLDAEFTVQNGIKFTDKEANFNLHLGGRFFLDAAAYFEDRNQDLGDSFAVSDARLEAEATLQDDWTFRASFGVTQTGSSGLGLNFDLKDLWASYSGFDPIEVKFGQHDEPFSLEQLTSSRRITFMRRGLPNALVPDNNIGLSVSSSGQLWTAQVGIFGGDFVRYREADANSTGLGFSGRFTTTPIRQGSRLVHAGGSLSAHKADSSDAGMSFRSRPEVALADVRYVDTGTIEGSERIYRLGLEAAFVQGPYSLQGEYMGSKVTRDGGLPDLWFDGWYVFASWFLTGERRPYIHEIGNFGAIDPKSKYGAVELATRYSTLDLTSKDVRGGTEENVSIGLNWYVHPQVRLMVNYIFVWADDDADDNGTLIGGDSPQIFQTRLQVNF